MEEAPTKEVVKALLDYLVDPLLPSKVSKKDPSLDIQEAVAKQMHAVVLLYNYYHRLQNPKLEFMEFGEFCKLAVSLKPTLIAHMKYMQQADLTGSDDMETHLSMTEKAIKNACKIALALTSLKDFSHVEKWPVSKVSVLLIDPKKDKCLMSFDTITNGVWSVIEKCINSGDLSLESPSKGKHTNKRKRKAGNELTCEPIDGELAYQQIALSSVMEATGLKQSEITVLEKHLTYSLSEENMAAYFYIMQSTASRNEDNQLPIKTVLESLQGPLLKWTSNDWILTQKIEYYDVLPYAQIMSKWLSRERGSDCSQTLNLSRFSGEEKDSETEAVDIFKVNSLQNLIVELENTNTNSSQGPENPNDGEVRNNMRSIYGNWTGADSWSKESSGADTSNRKEKINEKEKSNKESQEKPSDLAPNGADSHNRKEVGDEEKHDNCTTEKPSNKEIKDNWGSVFGNYIGANSCGKESTGADSSDGVEKVDEKEKPTKIFPEKPSDLAPNGADTPNRKEVGDEEKHDNFTTEKPSNKEIKDNWGSVFGNYTGANCWDKESTGADSSDGVEKVEEKEHPTKKFPEKPSDGEPTGADTSNRKEVGDEENHDNFTTKKASNKEIKDSRGSVFGNYTVANSCGKESTAVENSDGVEKVDEKEKPDKKSPEKPSDEEPTGADTSNREEVGDEEKHDNCTTEKPSNMEIKDNWGSVFGNYTGANSCGKESTGADSSDGVEKVDEKEKPTKKFPEKPSDGEPTGADTSNRKEVGDEEKHDNCSTEKASNKEIKDSRGSVFGNYTGANSCGKESTGAESSDGAEKVDEKEKPDKKSPEKPSDVVPTGADTLNRKEVGDEEKHDNCSTEKPSNKEIKDNWGSVFGNYTGANSCGKESTGADSSDGVEKVEEKEKPTKKFAEKPSDGEPTGADTSNRKEIDVKEKSDKRTLQNPSAREIQEKKARIYGNCSSTNACGKESIGVEKFYMEEDVDKNPDKQSHEFSSDWELTGVNSYNRNEEADSREKPDNNAPEKPSDRDVQENMHRDCMDVQSCGNESIGEESSNKEEVDTREKTDKYAPEMPIDVDPTRAVMFHKSSMDVDDGEKPDESTPEKPSNAESKDNVGNIFESCMGPNSCSEEPNGADSFNRKEDFDNQEKHVECYDISNSNSTSFSTSDTGVLKMISAEEPQTLPNFSSKRQKTSVYGIANRNDSMPIRVYHHQKRKISVESCPGSSTALTPCNGGSEAMKKSSRNEFIDGKVAGICTQGYLSSHPNYIPAENSALVPYDPNANDAGKMQTLLATKETEISETALRVLLQKREEMCYQQRILEDKIASCSRDIRKIIDGDEDALALKLEVMIDCCNETCLNGMINQSDVQRTGQCSRRNRQSDSILTFESSCLELDNMCHTNNWRLPVYLISALTGGFIAKIAMKEIDFDLSCEGELKSTPHAARDSAAALMVAKLRKT